MNQNHITSCYVREKNLAVIVCTSSCIKKRYKRVRSHNLSARSELKRKYITVKDPLNVCQNLKERFDHHKQEILANASTFFAILSSTSE